MQFGTGQVARRRSDYFAGHTKNIVISHYYHGNSIGAL